MKKSKNLRVLIVSSHKINARDQSSNGLLIRNLFGHTSCNYDVAQIFSGGDNNDDGFFGSYYKIGSSERRFGSVFERLKGRVQFNSRVTLFDTENDGSYISIVKSRIINYLRRLVVDSGLYELIFKIKISKKMLYWVREFRPDVIFAQGYSISFPRLAVALRHELKAPLVVFCSDDWPSYQYAGVHGEPTCFKWLVRPYLVDSAFALFEAADDRIAFGYSMALEYKARYKKDFSPIYHCDEPNRFTKTDEIVDASRPYKVVTAIGSFNDFRSSLLLDAAQSCQMLCDEGFPTRLVVIPTSLTESVYRNLKIFDCVDVIDDPGHEDLPDYLIASDLLLLIEGFDEKFVEAIKFSISSKAHLFMLSRRPILIYSSPNTGVAKYAREYGWANIVGIRSVDLLYEEMKNMLLDEDYSVGLVARAWMVANENHRADATREHFRLILERASGLKLKDGWFEVT